MIISLIYRYTKKENTKVIKYFKNFWKHHFVFEPCDPMEVKELITQLNLTKATGPNGIPTRILHLIKNEVCKPLSKIYNLSRKA